MKASFYYIRSIFFAVLIMLSATTFLAQKSNGNGNVVEQERNFSGFDAIEVSTGVDVILSQGSTEKVVVKTDAGYQDNVLIKKSGSTLSIRVNGGRNFNPKVLDVYITVKDLSKLTAHAGSDVESSGKLSLGDLEVYMSAGSDLEMELDANSLFCHLSGGSDASLEGAVKQFEVKAQGGSDIEAKKLKVQDCKLRLSGASDAVVTVNGNLDMEASGSSDIRYYGGASVVHSRTSGGSDIYGN